LVWINQRSKTVDRGMEDRLYRETSSHGSWQQDAFGILLTCNPLGTTGGSKARLKLYLS